MAMEVYQKLQEQLDQYSVGFPLTESGVEIRMLERLFTEEEAEMFLHLSMMLETPESVAQRTERDPEAVAALLDQMAEKGLIFRWHRDDIVKYGAVPYVLGISKPWTESLPRCLRITSRSHSTKASGSTNRP